MKQIIERGKEEVEKKKDKVIDRRYIRPFKIMKADPNLPRAITLLFESMKMKRDENEIKAQKKLEE